MSLPRWFIACFVLLSIPYHAGAQVWRSDQGDGTFRNPPLHADYPDPDIIRVGEDFYFVSTTFANSPGLTLLHSKDLVNWKRVTHIIPRLEGRPEYDLKGKGAYRHGIFAPSLRYHEGIFYVAVTPVNQRTRLYYAKEPKGPWSYTELDQPAFDPSLVIEPDGRMHLVTSGGWDGTVSLLTLNSERTKVIQSQKIHYIKGAEGSKLVKKDGWYYLFNSIPRQLALTVSRSRSLTGPYETRPQIDDSTGGHQGAIVDLPDGTWYGFVMLDAGPIGRVTNISPLHWKDEWPIWGTPEAPGRVPAQARKPIGGFPFAEPDTSDEFDHAELGTQWHWNHNPQPERWSLSARPGHLRLSSTVAPHLWKARNTLVQKGQAPISVGTAKIDLSGLKHGDRCGMGTFGKVSGSLVVERSEGDEFSIRGEVYSDPEGRIHQGKTRSFTQKEIYLRVRMDFTRAEGKVLYSFDQKEWFQPEAPFPLVYDWRTGTFQGVQFALFCYNEQEQGGHVDIDWFRLSAPLAEP